MRRFGVLLTGSCLTVTACSGRTQQKQLTPTPMEQAGGHECGPSASGGSGSEPQPHPSAGAPSHAAGAGGAPDVEPEPEPEPDGPLPNIAPPKPGHCLEPAPEMPPLLEGPAACGAGCRAVVAYPFDDQRGCIETAAGELVACSCGPQSFGTNNSESCLKTGDGRLWLVAHGNELGLYPGQEIPTETPPSIDTSHWGLCAYEDYTETLYPAPSCDLVSCATGHVDSHCSQAATRAAAYAVECSADLHVLFSVFDEQGCQRPSCAADDDCAESQRCTDGVGNVPTCTFDADGGCACGWGSGISFNPKVCVDVALAGPRGAWERYEIEDLEAGWYWHVTSEGLLSTNHYSPPRQVLLDAQAMAAVNTQLDSFAIRAGAAHGFDCFGDSGVSGTLKLVVAGVTYFRDVSGCFYDLPLSTLLSQY